MHWFGEEDWALAGGAGGDQGVDALQKQTDT